MTHIQIKLISITFWILLVDIWKQNCHQKLQIVLSFLTMILLLHQLIDIQAQLTLVMEKMHGDQVFL